jgi:NADPH:quinone reductase-like Zn-dependent oxidoreductase
MRAIRLHAFGPPENLVLEEVADPAPAPGQVRIAVEASGVHLVDTALRQGNAGGPFPLPELPTIPGREVAGTVDAVGEGVDPAWTGRRVAAHLGMVPGGYAERAVTDTGKLHVLPDALPADRAVAMLGTGRMTMGILRFADLSPSDTVLVLAAAGGIGSLLVQYARHRGATVVGAAGGPAKAAVVRDLGADLAVDYDAPDWADTIRAAHGDRPFTYVFEGVGGAPGRTAVDLLARGGTHLSYGYAATGFDPAGTALLDEAEQAARGVVSRSVLGPALLERIGGPQNVRLLEEESLALAAAGTLTPLVQRFPLADAAAAHRALESRGTTGKVVLIP